MKKPNSRLPAQLRGLSEYFDIKRAAQPGMWQHRCKVCREGWVTPDDPGRGGTLHLLNHAYGHKKGGV